MGSPSYLKRIFKAKMGVHLCIMYLEMLQYAGIGVAMGNASQEVKQAADMVTKNYDMDGIQYGFEACNLI